jgi:hypothetical protein
VDPNSGVPPVVNKAADVPDGMFLDGLGAVPGEPDLVLGADTAAGRVWQINLRTGVVRIAAQDDAFAPGAPATAFGINGLHVHGADLTAMCQYQRGSQKERANRPFDPSTQPLPSLPSCHNNERIVPICL